MKPIDPEREKHIRDLANTYGKSPSHHVWEFGQEIDRLRAELAVAQTEAAAARESAENIHAMEIDAVRNQVKKTIASSLITSKAGIIWDEALVEQVAKNGPLAVVAYAQLHIGNTLWMQTQG